MLYFYHVNVRVNKFAHLIKKGEDFESFGTIETNYEITTHEQFDEAVSSLKQAIYPGVQEKLLSQVEKCIPREFGEIQEKLLLNLEDIELDITAFNRL